MNGGSLKKSCEYCGKEFSYFPYQEGISKYCSSDCYHKASRVDKHKVCQNCGKTFIDQRCRKDRKYCSVECASKHRRESPKIAKPGSDGYMYIWLSDGTSIKEHRYIMEKILGRKLTRDEVVHHIDGNRANNAIENLQLMSRGEHSTLHRKQDIKNGKKLFQAGELG